ncbi:MAG: FAD-dependent oxidoreductase [Campylobacterales bacterium]
MRFDLLIIGSGVAGLYTALHLPSDWRVGILCKDTPNECNTYYAQGGIAAARDEADIEVHSADTWRAGCEVGDREAIHLLSKESIEVIADLAKRGMPFDRDAQGNFLYTREAAHSCARIVHAGGDATGAILHNFLMRSNPHRIIDHAIVLDLLFDGSRCVGVTVLRCCSETTVGYTIENYYAGSVVIASGGIGSLYHYHTNAKTVSGDLHGIAAEKGLALRGMEMTQFHPTVYVDTSYARKVLLTEALRGEGATVIDREGRRFLFDYDPRGELAARDAVSRAIFKHKEKGLGPVYLSFEAFEPTHFRERFPTVYHAMKEFGYNLPHDRVPISPAFHYMTGGIVCDLEGRIPDREGLYVVGEAASTGVHGANRLASNSLLEGLVFGRRAAAAIAKNRLAPPSVELPLPQFVPMREGDKEIKNQLRHLMWQKVGIVRTHQGLSEALAQIEQWLAQPVGRLLYLRLLAARAIVNAALTNPHSLGAHYLEDEG